MANSFWIENREYTHTLEIVDGKWKPVRIDSEIVPSNIFTNYGKARNEARKLNRTCADVAYSHHPDTGFRCIHGERV